MAGAVASLSSLPRGSCCAFYDLPLPGAPALPGLLGEVTVEPQMLVEAYSS